MPVPARSDTILDLLAPEERSLLPAAALTYPVETGYATEWSVNPVCEQLFVTSIARHGLVHVENVEVPRSDDELGDLGALGRVELSWRTEGGHDAVLSLEGGTLALLVCGHGVCEIVVAARTAATARRERERLAARLRAEPVPSDRVSMRFWAAAVGGGRGVRRRIQAPEWDQIDRNYPGPVRARLAALMAARRPAAGSLVLWHGAPGTGKTHALQALARAWRSWCSVHCITDPEDLLRTTSYLMNVATADPGEDADTGWRLIVLEDAGELMAASARAEIGQGLSRLLNLTDGLLGQGVRCILLVTTNEPIGRLHPAVRRPGRCWAAVEFAPFEPPEATAWLARRGVTHDVRGPATLAELFAIAEGREHTAVAAEGFGFARALRR